MQNIFDRAGELTTTTTCWGPNRNFCKKLSPEIWLCQYGFWHPKTHYFWLICTVDDIWWSCMAWIDLRSFWTFTHCNYTAFGSSTPNLGFLGFFFQQKLSPSKRLESRFCTVSAVLPSAPNFVKSNKYFLKTLRVVSSAFHSAVALLYMCEQQIPTKMSGIWL